MGWGGAVDKILDFFGSRKERIANNIEDLQNEKTIGGYTDLAKFLEGGAGEDS